MYRNRKELTYFGSDFNKFLNSLTKEMTVINIDCLQFKASKGKLRIIESKHQNEHTPPRQKQVLKILAKALKEIIIDNITFEVFIVKGDYPYNKLVITNLTTNEKDFELNGAEVKKWCEFEDISDNSPVETRGLDFPDVPDSWEGDPK